MTLDTNHYFESITHCPICKHSPLGTYAQIPFSKLKAKSVNYNEVLNLNADTLFTLSECPQCNFVFANPRLKEKYEPIIYDSVKKAAGTKKKKDTDVDRQRKIASFTNLAKLLRIIHKKEGLTLFDYGCGWGNTLSTAKALGLQGFGIDVDDTRVESCRMQGLTVATAAEFYSQPHKGIYDIIIGESIIEHIINLDTFLTIIKNISQPGTLLYLVGLTPDLIHIEKKKGLYIKAHFIEHINYFYPKTLDYFLGKAGFKRYTGKIILLNHHALRIPDWLTALLTKRNGFFEKVYVRE